MDEIESPNFGDVLSEDVAMSFAIQEARLGAGFVSPNPLVGCVILDSQNRFLTSGYHHVFGGPHAEMDALNNLSQKITQETDRLEALRGARVFVTLEPCAHQGKTPSCAKHLATLPLGEVIYGVSDPNPLVAGKGVKILAEGGIQVRHFSRMKNELEELCEHFLNDFRNHRVFVSVKVAASLDGQMALKNGQSQWITGVEARGYGQFLRGCHDAVGIGKRTALVDNPRLTIRHPQFAGKKKSVVVIFDRRGETLQKKLQIDEHHEGQQIWTVVSRSYATELRALAKARGQVISRNLIEVAETDGLLDLNEFLTKAYELGLRSLLIEGGGLLISSLLAKNLVDRLYLFQAPIIIGAQAGHSWTDRFRIEDLAGAGRLQFFRRSVLGDDLLWTGRLRN